MATPSKKTIKNFAKLLIDRTDNPDLFEFLLGTFLRSAREVAFDDALEALKKRRGQQTCYKAVLELKKREKK